MDKDKGLDLEALRGEIDGIDRELVDLLVKRLQVTEEVAKWKKEQNRPVYDAKREKELLNRVESLGGETYGSYIRTLYESLTSLSRTNQHRVLGGSGRTAGQIAQALTQTPQLFPEKAAVACQGVEGAYSQHAAEKLFINPDIRYKRSFEDVFASVMSGECRYGVLPLENSTSGSVRQVYDIMIRDESCPVYIVRSLRLKVDHCLLVKKDAELSGIREILSHEQALSQSDGYLKKRFPHVTITACPNTAVAAQTVAESDGSVAALASPDCAAEYGLRIAESDVQDNKNNYTRFICISKTLEIYPGAQKSSMVLVTEHRPGSLSRVLNRFNAYQINLTKLESRPIPGHDFEFMFYFDFECPVYSARLGKFFTETEQNCTYFRYLGTYSEML